MNTQLLKRTKELEGALALARQQLSFAQEREQTSAAALALVRGQLDESKKECANSRVLVGEQEAIVSRTQEGLDKARCVIEDLRAQAQTSSEKLAAATARALEAEARMKEEVSVRDYEVQRLTVLSESVSHELAVAQQRLKEEEATCAALSQQIQESQCLARPRILKKSSFRGFYIVNVRGLTFQNGCQTRCGRTGDRTHRARSQRPRMVPPPQT